jgi:hypothetical protein
MLFRGKIQDPFLLGLEQPELTHVKLLLLAQSLVFLEHLRVDCLEVLRYTLAHHPDRIDSIYQYPSWAGEQITGYIVDHGVASPLPTMFAVQMRNAPRPKNPTKAADIAALRGPDGVEAKL